MSTVYVKPREGGRVRMPERNSNPMPAFGAWIERGGFYERLLLAGDLIECDPPKPAVADATAIDTTVDEAGA